MPVHERLTEDELRFLQFKFDEFIRAYDDYLFEHNEPEINRNELYKEFEKKIKDTETNNRYLPIMNDILNQNKKKSRNNFQRSTLLKMARLTIYQEASNICLRLMALLKVKNITKTYIEITQKILKHSCIKE